MTCHQMSYIKEYDDDDDDDIIHFAVILRAKIYVNAIDDFRSIKITSTLTSTDHIEWCNRYAADRAVVSSDFQKPF